MKILKRFLAFIKRCRGGSTSNVAPEPDDETAKLMIQDMWDRARMVSPYPSAINTVAALAALGYRVSFEPGHPIKDFYGRGIAYAPRITIIIEEFDKGGAKADVQVSAEIFYRTDRQFHNTQMNEILTATAEQLQIDLQALLKKWEGLS